MKCGKVKNPCKICFQSVSNKTGIQCKGACKKWAHYKCLNYTPGKISDIKAGLIKITCPCPGCTTSEPKEILTNPPYTCTNQECPATKLPVCESTDCPSKQKPIPQFQPCQTPPRSATPVPPCAPPEPPPCIVPPPPPCKLPPPPPCKLPPSPPCTPPPPPPPPVCPTPPRTCPTPPRKSATPPRTCPTPPRRASPRRTATPPRRPISPERRGSPPRQKNARLMCPSCPMHCPQRNKGPQANENLCPPQESRSCSLISSKSSDSGKTCFEGPRSSSSDSELSNSQQYQKKVFCTIEEMCNTVGILSDQLRDLMCKMMSAFEKTK